MSVVCYDDDVGDGDGNDDDDDDDDGDGDDGDGDGDDDDLSSVVLDSQESLLCERIGSC